MSIAVAAIIMGASMPGPSSSGAPASHTGAPGEKTCATSGCHDDNTVNNGSALVSIDVGGGQTNYVEGNVYPVKIKISDTNKKRFGFQITAMGATSNTNLGTFLITDSIRTQVVKNLYELKERDYVTYTFNGTDAVSNGVGEWIVNWKAPSNCSEAITFYVGAVSANDDMTDKGDRVYTKSLTINK